MKNLFQKIAFYYKVMRSIKLASWGFDIMIFGLVFYIVSSWQTKDLISDDGNTKVPNFKLTSLSEEKYSLPNKKSLLYFFSPTCSICKLSIGNLEDLKSDNVEIYAIALAYSSKEQVEKFVKSKGLTIPVLLGNNQIMEQYKISAFPTYYILNSDHTVKSFDIGYTSELGLRWRLF
jgi:thioredoxin-related protein